MKRLQRAGLRSSRGVGLGHNIKCRSLGGECGIWVEVTLSMLSRFFTGAPYRLGLLTHNSKGNDMINVLIGHVHGGRHIIEGW